MKYAIDIVLKKNLKNIIKTNKMWKPIHGPGPWLIFQGRKDNVGVPLMEVRKKYMQEQLLFENYVSNIQQLNALSPNISTGGGPSSIYPDTIKVESLNDGVSQGVSIYTKTLDISGQKVLRDPQIIIEYSVLGVDCDYGTIYYERNTTQRPILSGWYGRVIPCEGKGDILTGPQSTYPYGDYGNLLVGEAYIVTPS